METFIEQTGWIWDILKVACIAITLFSSFLAAASKTFREWAIAPFIKKKEKIDVGVSESTLNQSNLTFVQQLQDFQNSELEKLVSKLKEQSADFEAKIDEKTKRFEAIIKEKDEIIKKQWLKILSHEAKMRKHNIEFEKYE